MTQPKKGRSPASRRKGSPRAAAADNGAAATHDWHNDQRLAQAMGENFEWFRDNEHALMRDHPEWLDRCLAIASRTPSKVLAVADDSDQALRQAMKTQELLELAAREGMPTGCLVTPVWLGIELGY
jgi:hypothetical protein